MRPSALLVALVFALHAAAPSGQPPPAPQRGRLLYENNCFACHTSSVHGRAQRLARTPAEIRAYVMRWSDYLDIDWTRAEVADVTAYLNDAYYHFPCEALECGGVVGQLRR